MIKLVNLALQHFVCSKIHDKNVSVVNTKNENVKLVASVRVNGQAPTPDL